MAQIPGLVTGQNICDILFWGHTRYHFWVGGGIETNSRWIFPVLLPEEPNEGEEERLLNNGRDVRSVFPDLHSKHVEEIEIDQ